MGDITIKPRGDRAVISVASHGHLPLKLNLNLRNKLRACWLILTGQELRISGPLEWKLAGYVGISPEQVAESFEAVRHDAGFYRPPPTKIPSGGTPAHPWAARGVTGWLNRIGFGGKKVPAPEKPVRCDAECCADCVQFSVQHHCVCHPMVFRSPPQVAAPRCTRCSEEGYWEMRGSGPSTCPACGACRHDVTPGTNCIICYPQSTQVVI